MPFWEAREVLDLLDVEDLPARGHVLDKARLQPDARGVQGRRKPGEPAAHDGQVVLVRHAARGRFYLCGVEAKTPLRILAFT